MKEVKELGYSRIPLSGLTTLGNRIIAALESRHPAEPFFQNNIASVKSAIGDGVLAVGSSLLSENTPAVNQADMQRKNSFNSLRNHIKAGLTRENETYRKACERLMVIFQRNNTQMMSLPLDERSAALESLFEDLGTVDMLSSELSSNGAASDLVTVNATAWLQELKDFHTAFEAAIQARNTEKSDRKVLTDEAAKDALVPQMKNLLMAVQVAYNNQIVAAIEDTIDLLNEIISEVVTAHRK